MAANVLIRHCTLRVARRGGWSWGADPRGLLGAAVARLPQLIGRHLEAAWPPNDERTIDAPLRIRLTIHVGELMSLARDARRGAPIEAAAESGLDRRIDAALREHVLHEAGQVDVRDRPSSPTAPALSSSIEGVPEATGAAHDSVLALLIDWHRQGVMLDTLLSFGPAALRAWYERLLCGSVDREDEGDTSADAMLRVLADAIAALPLPLTTRQGGGWTRRIALVVEASVLAGGSPRRVIDTFATHAAYALPRSPPDATEAKAEAAPPAHVDPIARGPDAAVPSLAPPRSPLVATSAAQPPRGTQWERDVPSVLPFLLAGPLSHIGYLTTLRAVFEAAGVDSSLWPGWAVALARKVLEPPRRGWHREPGATASAAAFAGLEVAPADETLARLGRALALQTTPLDAVIAAALTRGHRPAAAMLLQAATQQGRTGWLLCDTDGLFPIARADSLERLYATLAALQDPLLIVSQHALVPGLLNTLDDAGWRFVTDANPARGEAWRSLPGEPALWSNDRQRPVAALRAAALMLDSASIDAAALWAALIEQRPALPSGGDAGVERSLALAAALGLGMIAWTLWGAAGAATPLLALQRFGDLAGRAVLRTDHLLVQLPLGRRFLDLKQAGLLDDVRGVPWLGGRVLRFAQG